MPIAWSLAIAQLRHRPARWSLLALGVALVVIVPIVTAGLSSSVDAQAVRRLISQFSLSDRTLLVNQQADSVFNRASPDRNDAVVRGRLATLTGTAPLHELLFRPLSVNGSALRLGAVDELAHAVRVTTGRLPRTCEPKRCEVVVLGSASAKLRHNLATIGTVVVGTARRTNPLLISGLLIEGNPTIVVGGSVDEMRRLDALSLFARQYDWAAPIDADRVVALGVDDYVDRSADVERALSDRVGGITFYRPDTALQAAQERADTSTRRFALLGGFAAVLLLGFAVVAASGLRRDEALLTSVLRRRGATVGQRVLVQVVQVVLATLAGAMLGCLAGGMAAAGLAHGTARGPAGAAFAALGSSWPSIVLLAAAAGVVVTAVVVWVDAESRAVWRILDVVAVACLGAALLAADRGSVSSGELASSGDPLVVALPVLASVTAGLVAARLWAPAARLCARLLPRRSVAGRIALVGAVRRPLRPVATVAFLTAAVAAVVFAGAYRATLLANDGDQAAYQVPLDATIASSPADLTPYVAPDAFGPQGRVFGVTRASAGVTRLAGVVDSVPVVVVDRAALPLIPRWGRVTGSSLTATTVSHRLAGVGGARRPTLPVSTRAVSITVHGYDPNTAVTMYVRSSDGRSAGIALTLRAGQLVGAVPRLGGTVGVTAFGVEESFDHATHHAHATGEGNKDVQQLAGTIRFGAVRADGRTVSWDWSAWSSVLGRVSADAASLALRYSIDAAPVLVSPGGAAAAAVSVPVVVDPQTAQDAHGGALRLVVDSAATVPARVVAVLPRLAGTSGRFVLADTAAWVNALAPREPAGNPSEFWVAAPPTSLDRSLPRYALLDVSRRSTVQADLDADPIGRGARTLLVVIALLCLAIAAVALMMLVIGERRDGAGELYAWEADGVSPRTLRRVLVGRLSAVAAVAVPVGVIAGLVLARVGTTLVAVDASGATPTPPLEVTLGSAWTPLALVAGVGAGLLAGWLVAAASLRERLPVPAEVDLR